VRTFFYACEIKLSARWRGEHPFILSYLSHWSKAKTAFMVSGPLPPAIPIAQGEVI
jgi:hypothetical protein